MKVLVTGSAGRVGRAICARMALESPVIGLDLLPSPTTHLQASITDTAALRAALRGVEVVIHAAALHAPHVGHQPDEAFDAVNVRATEALARLAAEQGVRSFVFTSTTALYGAGLSTPGEAAWLDEDSEPRPRTVYHRTKLQAEARLEAIARDTGLPVTVIRMGRCFPEAAPWMALCRLHRGVDVRDVAHAHALAAMETRAGFRRFVVSGNTPFLPEDRQLLASHAAEAIERRCPALALAFRRRGWPLPATIDRVYDPRRASALLNWRAAHGFEAVLAQWDGRSPEVLPPDSGGSACP